MPADQNKDRREVVRRKTSEYLLYAENLQKKLSIMSSVKTDATPTASQQVSWLVCVCVRVPLHF